MEIHRRDLLKLAGAAAATTALAGCSGSSLGGDKEAGGKGGPIKIGMIVPQSGTYKALGDDLAHGFETYLGLKNNELGGRKVELIKVDEGETAESGKAAGKKLIEQEKVHALTGVISSLTIMAIKDMVEEAKIPLVGSNASPGDLKNVKYIWRTSYVNNDAGTMLGAYVAKNVNGPVYLIAADYAAGKDQTAGFLKTFPKERKVGEVYTPFVPPTSNFVPYLSQIKNSGAKAVFCFYAGKSAVDFVKQYKQTIPDIPLYAAGFLTEGTVLDAQGDAAVGILTAMNYSPDLDNAANKKFVAEYTKRAKVAPTTYAMASYDAAAVLDTAIAAAGANATAESINAQIGKVGDIDSPRGTWHFNAGGTPVQKWYLREVRRDGAKLTNARKDELGTRGSEG